ncbi:hypothetical protein AXW84_13025 [Hymenobacter sp. PAMC 26628]|nr:hypothetical protein AXW84_13025 [Hymenobacter sp. PAMC 26628]
MVGASSRFQPGIYCSACWWNSSSQQPLLGLGLIAIHWAWVTGLGSHSVSAVASAIVLFGALVYSVAVRDAVTGAPHPRDVADGLFL